MARILIIDADRKAAEFLRNNLAAAGHECLVEDSGARALLIAQRSTPDLFIMDIVLAESSGFEVCRNVRRLPGLYSLPILVLSTVNDEEEVRYVLAQGADDYMTKPFAMDRLHQRVGTLLAASAEYRRPDALTGLPNARRIQRALQHRISRKVALTLAYVEFTGLREFTSQFGPELRDKAILWLGNVLRHCGQEVPPDALIFGHMGGGHFVCILKPEESSYFCTRVRRYCQMHMQELYAALKLANAYRLATADIPGQKPPPLLDALICLTYREPAASTTARQLFEILSQIRQKALALQRGGIHVDRRRIQPSAVDDDSAGSWPD